MASTGGRAYNGGPRAEPSAVPRAEPSAVVQGAEFLMGEGVIGRSPPEADSILALENTGKA